MGGETAKLVLCGTVHAERKRRHYISVVLKRTSIADISGQDMIWVFREVSKFPKELYKKKKLRLSNGHAFDSIERLGTGYVRKASGTSLIA